MDPLFNTELDKTLGALEIGIIVGVFLFGITTKQMLQYYSNHPDDRHFYKVLVGWVWILELVHCTLSVWTLYVFTVKDFGRATLILTPPTSLVVSGLVSSIITGSVQAYFSYRLRVLSQRWLVPCICWMLNGSRLVCFSASIIYQLATGTQPAVWRWPRTAAGIMSALGDLLVGLSLCYCMWKRRERNRQTRRRRSAIDWTFTTALQSDLITCIATAITLILYEKDTTWAWQGLTFVVCRLFSISFYSSLLARTALRDSVETTVDLTNRVNMSALESNHSSSQAGDSITEIASASPLTSK
ncbi:hypothetical protein BDN72DRAFT_834899 [Pluteus cervinus]|uniref:Uncharacterized protein n=1 Tax=Pluteus cervinus TaxID=181527 RepID=A0ACD3B6D3_9AGAR|nr:hypothetical protein BDN72DRAFT_834899 [Pluteus cervinus]